MASEQHEPNHPHQTEFGKRIACAFAGGLIGFFSISFANYYNEVPNEELSTNTAAMLMLGTAAGAGAGFTLRGGLREIREYIERPIDEIDDPLDDRLPLVGNEAIRFSERLQSLKADNSDC